MVKVPDCPMCHDTMFSEHGGDHPQIIARLGVCTAVLNKDWQYFKGSTILVFQDHVIELHHLSAELQHRFVDDAARMAAALEKTFPDIKLNHGLFGNIVPHLHWHMIVRRQSEPDPMSSIWELDFPKLTPSDEDFRQTADAIRLNL